ncbi:histidinol dehydrogenase [Candidatus Vondammii sp. HM_W22]|uniref:histidinol dehydrogenase n=1 Tax=Candidatus Vondammii sp. HM_W22 TaxID=2687299 RepID=UPI001F136CC5|nr:histidinol dehydrogenase [Candidatus Vondammii sp. HM_W22]
MADIAQLSTTDTGFQQRLEQLLAWESVSDGGVNQTVNDIIVDIRSRGDDALLEYTSRFDGWDARGAADLEIPAARLAQAWSCIPEDQRQALAHAAERVRIYHEKQKTESWSYTEEDGTLLGQQVTAIERVGLYVPGGKAAYPSSVLMNALPAKVAGVQELIMVVPTPGGELNELVLAAAHLCGVDRVFAVGGAQAVAALAYGTESIPPVDKVVGPGNIYVATAKRAVFGQVGIDMVAGPSEILVICDGKTNPDWVAMDLFSQAEHDEDAQSILLCPDKVFVAQVKANIDRLLPTMEREPIIATALKDRGALIHCRDLDEACEVSNFIAPEHLELSVDNPQALAPKIRHAGAIFMGRYTSEPLGDYCAGPNHVLPTSRTARFSSPLGVYDFQKRSSLIMVSETGSDTLGKTASVLARGEGLTAHARSAEYRFKDK